MEDLAAVACAMARLQVSAPKALEDLMRALRTRQELVAAALPQVESFDPADLTRLASALCRRSQPLS